MAKLYEEYLKELFGPNPRQIYVKHYNEFAKKIRPSLLKCEKKFGRTTTKDENHYCYYSAMAKHAPSLITALRNAAKTECKGNSGCANSLNNMANQMEKNELPKMKKLRDEFKKKI
jgi:hypothetical protein